MSHGGREVDSATRTLLILGANGDLTSRWLLPGLGGLVAGGEAEGLLLIGSGRADWDDDHWRTRVADSFAAENAGGDQVDAVVKGARYLRADATAENDLQRLWTPARDALSSISPCRQQSP
jgi:glucose-6-phosphate 1-dehydrogenase